MGYGEKVLLSDLYLQLRQGARVALVGPNGSGKTTLVRTIAGVLPPLAGRVRPGANVRIGYMAQEQESLDPALDAFTTIRNLAPMSDTDARALSVLSRLASAPGSLWRVWWRAAAISCCSTSRSIISTSPRALASSKL